MAIPVIYSNSTAGMIERYLLRDLINERKIIAYKDADSWVEITGDIEKEGEEPVIDQLVDQAIKPIDSGNLPSSVDRPMEDENMLIGVIYKNNKRGMIDEYLLDDLIKQERIKAFRRSSGWVRIGRDPIREKWKPSSYSGQERRKHELPPDYFL